MLAVIITLLAGEALLTVGLWLIFPPAALIVLGAQCVVAALLVGGSE